MTISTKFLSLVIRRIIALAIFLGFFLLLIPNYSAGQKVANADVDSQDVQQNIAPVKIDGVFLFYVRGISSFPAEMRASTIGRRIMKAASNPSISSDSVRIVEGEDALRIFAGEEFIMNVYDVDADADRIDKGTLAQLIKQKTSVAINSYRYDRSRPVIINNILRSLVALVLMTVILIAMLWLIRRINRNFQSRIKTKIETMETKSFKLIKSNQLWKAFNVFFKSVKLIVIVFTIGFFINYILGLFPWTNSSAVYILNLFMTPVISMGNGFLNFLPSLAFLIVIFFVTKYILNLIKLFFSGIEHGGIVINNFDSDWAMPTFRILRTFIIAFSVIIAYPYIPGSESSAFKGVSVFLGILFSLGSSSFIGNLIAGYSMTYRRAFKKGDRIKVDNIIGYVEDQQLLVTRLRSFKNEEIIIPNSVLLNSNIVNYNTRAKDIGVIIHVSVGIGYETPWRQVDAMLKLAANRTEGLPKEPPPYVLKHSLDDFAVKYEINAYCKDVSKMQAYKTDLIQNILDIFNENNVQIMTPSYEGDPETAKVVPKEQWDTPVKS